MIKSAPTKNFNPVSRTYNDMYICMDMHSLPEPFKNLFTSVWSISAAPSYFTNVHTDPAGINTSFLGVPALLQYINSDT